MIEDATDDQRRAVGDRLRAQARWLPEHRFCGCADDVFTFAEMNVRSDQVAAGFARSGVVKGDRIAVLSPNRIEVLELFFGLAKLGAIQVPINVFLKGEFLRYQLAHSRASVLVVDEAGWAAIEPLCTALPDVRFVVHLDASALPQHEFRPISQVYRDVIDTDEAPPHVEVNLADTMSIVYTSGTTGLPKGCILSHGYYARAGRVVANALELTSSDVLYTAMPLFHAGARLLVLNAALLRGLPAIIDPAFSARRFLPRAAEIGATVVIGVGAMGHALLALPESPVDRAHNIHTMLVAPFSPADQERFTLRFGIDAWVEVYGQTECVPLTCTPRSGSRNRTSVGRPAEDLEVALLDDDRPVATGDKGEICIRPRERYAMFDGYWSDPESTLKSFGGLWYHTGDYGRLLDDGSIVFVDRKKDSLRRRGENVSSLELEAAIATHPEIAEVAVCAVPSGATEDDIKAYLVVAGGIAPNPSELFAFFQDNLPYFAIPRYVELVDELPRNAVGRVLKFELRERALTDAVWDFTELGFGLPAGHRRGAAAAPQA